MGCDGGTIPTRDELVKTKKKPEKIDRDIENAAKWKYCAASQEPLKEPICACPLGRLYNKDIIIQCLLNKTISEIESAKHIRSIKDVKELNLTKNSAFQPTHADKGDSYVDYNVAQFICPVVGLEMNGKYRFGFIWSCGCVVSERALKEVKSDVCHKCGQPYSQEDVVILYGTDEEVAEYERKLEAKREMQKADKKNKKALKSAATTVADAPDANDRPSTSAKPASTKHKLEDEKPSTSSSNGATTSKKSKSSIQSDPNTSAVFKSLFTSSESGKTQPRAHWVTYNPLYY